MCGLLGFYLDEKHGIDKRVVPLMAVLSTQMEMRGSHSYGYFHDGEVTKDTGAWTDHVLATAFENFRVVMGHTRAATVGAKTKENAHPFTCGNIIGAHNGSVRNWEDLNKKYDRKFEVDSTHIFAHIDEGKSLKELHGYGAITYIKRDDPLMRPFMAKVTRGGDLEVAMLLDEQDNDRNFGIVWCSTAPVLKAALRVSGFKYTIATVRPEVLHFFDPSDDSDKDGVHFFYDTKLEMEFGYPTYTYSGGPIGKPTTPPTAASSYVWHGSGSRGDMGDMTDWDLQQLWNQQSSAMLGKPKTRVYHPKKDDKKDDLPSIRTTKVTILDQHGKALRVEPLGTDEMLKANPDFRRYEGSSKKSGVPEIYVVGKCGSCETMTLVHMDPSLKVPVCLPCGGEIDDLMADGWTVKQVGSAVFARMQMEGSSGSYISKRVGTWRPAKVMPGTTIAKTMEVIGGGSD